MSGSFPPSPLVVSASKVYSGLGADIVMESFHSLTCEKGEERTEAGVIAWLQQLPCYRRFSDEVSTASVRTPYTDFIRLIRNAQTLLLVTVLPAGMWPIESSPVKCVSISLILLTDTIN